jgi:hypothetical protein
MHRGEGDIAFRPKITDDLARRKDFEAQSDLVARVVRCRLDAGADAECLKCQSASCTTQRIEILGSKSIPSPKIIESLL